MSDFWDRVGALFETAVALPAAEQEAFVNAADADEDVKKEVRSLLTAHTEATGFLEHPAAPPPPEDPADTPLLPEGTMLGQYRIVRCIGEGGMGVVYEAWDTRLERVSAVKSLKLSRADADRERIRREALAAARLNHAGIATVYALEEFEAKLYIVSEYVAGDTLRSELERCKLPIASAISTALEVARALCAAHEGGVIHRDLKPENIIRRPDGSVKIVDFGVAQFDEAARERLSITRVTQSGLVVGTPSYMSPEQLLAKGTDSRTDQFAFGVLLYELCTGRHPFGGTSLPSIIARILAAEPDPPARDDEIPDGLWQVIERCLQKDPAGRFPSTRDLVSALESVNGSNLVVPTAPVPPAPSEPVPVLQRATLKWWRFHQLAAFVVYVAMVWPVWRVHQSLGRAGLFFFFATLVAVVVAGMLRLHLLFSSGVHPEDLAAARADDGPWIRRADILFCTLLIVGGIALPSERVGWATLLIAVGIGALLAALFIEPATARVAFPFEARDRDARLAR